MGQEIEIPFGAKDSELKGWEYTIPEGFEAEIKDGKIVVKQAESEDERMIDYAYGLCYAAHETAHSAQEANKATKCMSWLKSLRPQPHWKPSEEQMNMLLAIVNDSNNAGAESCHLAMQSLYNDLKKLM